MVKKTTKTKKPKKLKAAKGINITISIDPGYVTTGTVHMGQTHFALR